MSTKTNRHQFGNGCIDIMNQPWYVDLITGVLVLSWMGWTFTVVQSQGPTPTLILAALVVGIVGLLAIHGQYVTYFRLGDWLLIGRRPPHMRADEGEHEQEREQGRQR